MQIIRCTQKLQKEMGLSKKDLVEFDTSDLIMGSWFANLIYISGKKCVLFANEKTLYNFIVCGLPRAQIRQLDRVFLLNLQCNLSAENISEEFISAIVSECSEIVFGKTNSRSVLGSMNELSFMYKYHIESEGGIHSYKVPEIIKYMNRHLFSVIDISHPIDVLQDLQNDFDTPDFFIRRKNKIEARRLELKKATLQKRKEINLE
jgi:Domain of unknown function (DUF6933)